MARLIKQPVRIEAAGNKPKFIDEYAGRASTGTDDVSIARMRSPEGWSEPGQKPEFDEYTVVLKGNLKVKCLDSEYIVGEGEAIIVNRGEWVQYSSPLPGGAEYIAVCLPAFSPDTVHRDR